VPYGHRRADPLMPREINCAGSLAMAGEKSKRNGISKLLLTI
jgi:hypothetical protein